MPLVYALALGIGLASAFSIPSGSSMLPNVVAPDHLQMANGMLMGMRVLTALAGPLLAGAADRVFRPRPARHAGIADARGLGIAFALDALTFAVTIWTLHRVQLHAGAVRAPPQPVFAAVGHGLAMVWRDAEMRSAFLYWGVISFVVGGTMQVAMPVLANSRLGGAAALGLIMGAHGAGSLVGMGLSTVKGDLRIGTLGTTLLLVDGIAGLLLMLMGGIDAAWQGAALMLTLGALAGFMQVAVFTWIQRRVPREMLGRTMSIFMFILMGLAPLAASLTGLVMQQVTPGAAVHRRRPVPAGRRAAGILAHTHARDERCEIGYDSGIDAHHLNSQHAEICRQPEHDVWRNDFHRSLRRRPRGRLRRRRVPVPVRLRGRADRPRLARYQLQLVLFNLPAGDWTAGERGIACDPRRIGEFQDSVALALDYAGELGVRQLHCLAGKVPPNVPHERAHDTYVANLKFAAAALREHGVRLLIEPINTFDMPGYFLSGSKQALAIIDECGADNLFLQYDIYHMQRMEGELANTIRANLARIGHIQLADNPGRHEPGTGEINYPFLFGLLDEIGYDGWVGCEYIPSGDTAASLAWRDPWLPARHHNTNNNQRNHHDPGPAHRHLSRHRHRRGDRVVPARARARSVLQRAVLRRLRGRRLRAGPDPGRRARRGRRHRLLGQRRHRRRSASPARPGRADRFAGHRSGRRHQRRRAEGPVRQFVRRHRKSPLRPHQGRLNLTSSKMQSG